MGNYNIGRGLSTKAARKGGGSPTEIATLRSRGGGCEQILPRGVIGFEEEGQKTHCNEVEGR